jgi:tetratricopeptide (TPR) repeat protein
MGWIEHLKAEIGRAASYFQDKGKKYVVEGVKKQLRNIPIIGDPLVDYIGERFGDGEIKIEDIDKFLLEFQETESKRFEILASELKLMNDERANYQVELYYILGKMITGIDENYDSIQNYLKLNIEKFENKIEASKNEIINEMKILMREVRDDIIGEVQESTISIENTIRLEVSKIIEKYDQDKKITQNNLKKLRDMGFKDLSRDEAEKLMGIFFNHFIDPTVPEIIDSDSHHKFNDNEDKAIMVTEEKAKEFELSYDEKVPIMELYLKFGNAEYFKNNYKQSIIHFDNAIELNNDYEKAWYNKGVAYGHLNDFHEAIHCYDNAIRINSKNEKIWYNKGVVLGEIKKYKEAIDCYNEAILIKPDYEFALYNKAIVLGKTGQYKESINYFNVVTRISADNGNAWYGIACIYSLKNDLANSITYLKKSIKIDKNCKQMAIEDKDFDNIRDDPRFTEIISK